MADVRAMCRKAKTASRELALLDSAQKNAMLNGLADWLRENQVVISAENDKDIAKARKAGLDEAMIERLRLTEGVVKGMAVDIQKVAALPDPVGEVFEKSILANGLRVRKVRVPLGVIAVVYESRPNVTVDAAALALKSGNAVVLRGGSETLHSNRVLAGGIRRALERAGITPEAVQFIDEPDRELVTELLKMHEYVDLLIPRGGAGLHRFCKEHSSIPVITGGIGICHLFVDDSADLKRAVEVVCNAKVQRPTVCNALDTALVHRAIARDFIPRLVAALKRDGVSFRMEAESMRELGMAGEESVTPAEEEDFYREWLSLTLGVRVVAGLEEAMAHIAAHSTGHSDGILTGSAANAERFQRELDSAVVYVNASTRFTDGGELGLGAEVAVSTQRLHARGPMGLRELTTYKWVVEGDYTVRD